MTTLTDGVLTLVPLTVEDIAAHNAGEDAASIRWLNEGLPSTEASTRAWIERNQAMWAHNGPIRNWGIRLTASGELIGNVEANWELERLAPGEVNLSYVIFPAWRGEGHATRAARLALGYLAAQPDLHTAILRTHPDNVASQHVATALGFTECARGEDAEGPFIDAHAPLARFAERTPGRDPQR